MNDLSAQHHPETAAINRLLLNAAKTALAKHPVLEAMATQIAIIDDGGTAIRFTFDGPALPEKQFFQVSCSVLPSDDELIRMIADTLPTCERAIAAAMRKAGYAGGAG
jgi:hypothetical protein